MNWWDRRRVRKVIRAATMMDQETMRKLGVGSWSVTHELSRPGRMTIDLFLPIKEERTEGVDTVRFP